MKYLQTFIFTLVIVWTAGAEPVTHKHGPEDPKLTTEVERPKAKAPQLWTCSMHPQIKLPKPGKCPICHMSLIPLSTPTTEDEDSDAPVVSLGKRAAALLDIQTTPVKRKWVDHTVRLVGEITLDESRVKQITAWVPGRIERMFVDYTGISVRANDHMVSLYSPELVSAQEEFIQAARSLKRIEGGSAMVRNSTERSLKAARDKLLLLGLTETQVSNIERRGVTEDSVTIFSPMGGTVIEKHANEGMYVQTGTRIYTIADLSQVWLRLNAYESDLPWIRYGQDVTFIAEAIPGERFRGTVSFVHPLLNEQSRTVAVRVNVDNPEGRLKPGMFVTAYIKARMDSKGKVYTASLSGKYVCPMHPEIIAEQPGQSCPLCGMRLEKVSSESFMGSVFRAASRAPLVIPASAPLITGKRAVVYVKRPKRQRYVGREVILGPKAGDHYIVRAGLKAGERVVTKGAFKLDADLQLRGIQSMMNPPEPAKSATQPAEHSHLHHSH